MRTTSTACQVLVNPEKIRLATYDALRVAINNQSSRLIISGCYQGDWDFNIHATKDDGLANIAAVWEQAQRPDCLRCREVTPTAMARPDTAKLTDALELIKAHDGRLDSEFLAKLGPLIDRRFMVCSWQPEAQLWRVEHGGSGFAVSRHLDVSRHQTIGNQPSFEYGCWLHDRYCEVMMRGTPAVIF